MDESYKQAQREINASMRRAVDSIPLRDAGLEIRRVDPFEVCWPPHAKSMADMSDLNPWPVERMTLAELNRRFPKP